MSENKDARAHRLCGYCAREYKQPNNKITCQGEVPKEPINRGSQQAPCLDPIFRFPLVFVSRSLLCVAPRAQQLIRMVVSLTKMRPERPTSPQWCYPSLKLSSTFTKGIRKTIPLLLLISGNHWQQIQLFIKPSPSSPGVLASLWLRLYNPQLNWMTSMLTSCSIFCHTNCLHSALSSQSAFSSLFLNHLISQWTQKSIMTLDWYLAHNVSFFCHLTATSPRDTTAIQPSMHPLPTGPGGYGEVR